MREEERESIKEEEYLYIVLRQHLCRVSLTKLLLEEKEPPIETLLYFPDEEDLPVGMGAFALDSSLFLIGGEILKKGERLHPYYSRADRSIFESLSDGMFIYNHHHPNQIKKVSSMVASKPSPQVAILDGKLYVFAGTGYTYVDAAPEPRFECYDPKTTDWEVLPNPPFYYYEPPSFLCVSVIGRRIFVTNPMGVSTYDVDDRTWTLSRDVEDTPFEFLGRVIAESDDGTVVGYTSCGVVAYLDGSLVRAQILEDLNSRLPFPCFIRQAAFLGYLGAGIYYLLLSEMHGRVTGDWDMHIVLFRLEMLPQEEEEARIHEVKGEGEADFCCITVLRHHVYNAMKDITEEVFNPTHAFTMWSSADRGNRGRGAEELKEVCQLSKTLEERDKLLPPPGRIPDYVPVLDAKPLSLSAKRNRKKKEKRLRKLRGWNSEASSSAEAVVEESVASSISSNPSVVTGAPSSSAPQGNDPVLSSVDKKIRALEKKIRVLKKKLGLDDEQMARWEELYRELILLQLQKAVIAKEEAELPLMQSTALARLLDTRKV